MKTESNETTSLSFCFSAFEIPIPRYALNIRDGLIAFLPWGFPDLDVSLSMHLQLITLSLGNQKHLENIKPHKKKLFHEP